MGMAKGFRTRKDDSQVLPDILLSGSQFPRIAPEVMSPKTSSGNCSNSVDSTADNNGNDFQRNLYIRLVYINFLLLVILSFCFVRKRCFKRIRKIRQIEEVNIQQTLNSSSSQLISRSTDNLAVGSMSLDSSIRHFSPNDLTLLVQIGHGSFGKVFKGRLNREPVAVKIVQSEQSKMVIREVEIMARFAHPNILPLLGIVQNPETESPWMLFEYMNQGDLLSVFRGRKFCKRQLSDSFPPQPASGRVSMDEDSYADQPFQLTQKLLVNFALQLAEGMKYLSNQRFVHRDLAARNCRVSDNGTVKISDFGMARDIYACDYYKVGGSRVLPIRWTAPESIAYGCFSQKSDVWAYGVLLWEMYTWGKQPYYGLSNAQVVQQILSGVYLYPPLNSPPAIQEIMKNCWKSDTLERFTFSLICEILLNAQTDLQQDNIHVNSPADVESEYEVPIVPMASHIEYFQIQQH